MSKGKTNVQAVKSMMEYSNFGALAQVFILQAIEQYADAVAASTPKELDTPMISGEAWHGVALEIKAKLAEHYKS